MWRSSGNHSEQNSPVGLMRLVNSEYVSLWSGTPTGPMAFWLRARPVGTRASAWGREWQQRPACWVSCQVKLHSPTPCFLFFFCLSLRPTSFLTHPTHLSTAYVSPPYTTRAFWHTLTRWSFMWYIWSQWILLQLCPMSESAELCWWR